MLTEGLSRHRLAEEMALYSSIIMEICLEMMIEKTINRRIFSGREMHFCHMAITVMKAADAIINTAEVLSEHVK